jgi:hypothetical protein
MNETINFSGWIKNITPTRLLVIILAVGILLRVVVALVMGDRVEVLPGIFDQLSYDRLAQNVLAGNGFSFEQDWWPLTRAGEPTAHWSYAMTLYLVGVYRIFGQHPLAARLIQAIAGGILMPWLVYHLAKRTFRTRKETEESEHAWGFEEVAALLAAAWTAFYGYFIYYAAALMTETFYITCILWTLDCAQRIAERTAPSPEKAEKKQGKLRNWLYLELGLAAGMTILFRQAFLLFLPFLFAWLRWASSRQQRPASQAGDRRGSHFAWLPKKSLVVGNLATVLVIGVMILPFTAFNYTRFHRFVLLNTNSGYAFFWANHPSLGVKPISLSEENAPPYQQLIPEELRSLDEAALDQALLKIGFGYILSDPKRYLQLSLARIPEHFIFWPLPNSPLLSNLTRVGSLGVALPFSFLGLISWAIHFYRRSFLFPQASILLLIFLLIYTNIHVFSWAGIRYRLPVDPFLIMFSAYGLLSSVSWLRARLKIKLS